MFQEFGLKQRIETARLSAVKVLAALKDPNKMPNPYIRGLLENIPDSVIVISASAAAALPAAKVVLEIDPDGLIQNQINGYQLIIPVEAKILSDNLYEDRETETKLRAELKSLLSAANFMRNSGKQDPDEDDSISRAVDNVFGDTGPFETTRFFQNLHQTG